MLSPRQCLRRAAMLLRLAILTVLKRIRGGTFPDRGSPCARSKRRFQRRCSLLASDEDCRSSDISVATLAPTPSRNISLPVWYARLSSSRPCLLFVALAARATSLPPSSRSARVRLVIPGCRDRSARGSASGTQQCCINGLTLLIFIYGLAVPPRAPERASRLASKDKAGWSLAV